MKNKKKLIPRGLEGLWAKLNKWFGDNIKKINNNTPLNLKEGETSNRPLPMYNTANNIRGNKRIAKNGTKFNK